MCCLGISKPLVLSMLRTIQAMQHHMHTAYGNSQHYMGQSTWATLVVGIGGQSNSASLAVWVAISLPLFEIMKEEGFLAMVSCAMSSHKKYINGFVFIYDTNLCVSSQITT